MSILTHGAHISTLNADLSPHSHIWHSGTSSYAEIDICRNLTTLTTYHITQNHICKLKITSKMTLPVYATEALYIVNMTMASIRAVCIGIIEIIVILPIYLGIVLKCFGIDIMGLIICIVTNPFVGRNCTSFSNW